MDFRCWGPFVPEELAARASLGMIASRGTGSHSGGFVSTKTFPEKVTPINTGLSPLRAQFTGQQAPTFPRLTGGSGHWDRALRIGRSYQSAENRNGLALAIGPVWRMTSPKGPSKQVCAFFRRGDFTTICEHLPPKCGFRKRLFAQLFQPIRTVPEVARQALWPRVEGQGSVCDCRASLTGLS